jgi:hypothetical protein
MMAFAFVAARHKPTCTLRRTVLMTPQGFGLSSREVFSTVAAAVLPESGISLPQRPI